MSLEQWLTDRAIKAVFDKLEKRPIRISGLDQEDRDLMVWVVPPKKEK